MHATESLSVDEAFAALPGHAQHARKLFTRLRRIVAIGDGAAVVDIGAAQGLFLIACARLGYRAVGVEPWHEARATARGVAQRAGAEIELVDGTAESVPLSDASFDVVHAKSVIEHVDDAEAAFAEAYRLLKPGGVLWFYTASSLCPRQTEIRGFPAFGWYPDALKRRIMTWAVRRRPELVGNTQRPAMHWFTPWKARRMLRAAGFSRIYDRWELRHPQEERGARKALLSVLCHNASAKLFMDVAVAGCSYAAVK